MRFEHFIVDALRVAVVLGLALLAMVLLQRRAPAARRIVLATALVGALFMPFVSAVAPAWRLPSPIATVGLGARALAERLVEGNAAPAAGPSVAATVKASGLSVTFSATPHVDWRALIAVVWALGALLVLTRLAAGLGRSRALVRQATPARQWAAAVERAERATGLRADVRVTDAVGVPAVTGMVRPVVLVPRASESWDDDRRHAVLLHELAHVRQMDCLIQFVAQLACAIHWFDPLVWIAARRLRFERELAADEAVLAAGARASHYAEDLLAIASTTWTAGDVPSGSLGMGERSHLAARITAIVSTDRVRRSLTRAHAASLCGACALLVVAVACTTPTTGGPGVAPSAAAPMAEAQAPTAQSSVRPALQKIADEELDRTLAETGAQAATILVLEPSTGEILADAGKDHGVPADVAVRSAYVAASTMKPVVLAAALDEGVVSLDERIDCEHGAWKYPDGKVLQDHDSFGVLTIPEMMAVSSNVGFAKMQDRLGGQRLGRWLHAFHFGEVLPVDGSNPGSIPERIEDHSFAGGLVALGEGMTASPLHIAAAYATLANGGEYVAPTRTPRSGPAPHERLMKAETAREVVRTLENVVYAERATGGLARVEGVRVAGKTGTGVWDLPGGGEAIYSTFVGLVPSTATRFVILVGVDQAKGDDLGGGTIAAPVFARVATRALAAH